MKTILLTSLLAVALSSGAAFAGARHCHHHLAYTDHARQYAQGSYSNYAPAPVETPRYHDPFGTYDVEPSPVTDQ